MFMRLLAIILLIILSATLSLGEGSNVSQEDLIKARYLLNIPLFTEMPNHKKNGESYVVCMAGSTALENVLLSSASEKKQIKGRPLEIRRVDDLSQLRICQVLFIAASERYRVQQILPEAHRLGIMTMSDMRDFTKAGGIVALVSGNNRITYDLNLVSARSAGISFSTQILKLANDVIN